MSVSACRHLLVIEDDRDIRDSLQQVLEFEGYRVTTACNGREAWDRLSTIDTPCLILLDLMMPVMNGWQFSELLRSDQALSSIPLIVVSAYSDKAGTLPCQGIIRKPVEMEVLLSNVRRFCV